jgi:hypothetical protein
VIDKQPHEPLDVAEVRRRQAARARVMGVGLFALAALFFAITIAKIGILEP